MSLMSAPSGRSDDSLAVRRTLPRAALSLFALFAALALICVPAGAEVTHKYLSSITEVPAQGPNGETIAQPGLLAYTNTMTIDGGDLYLAEQLSTTYLSRTDVFDTATHAFVRQFDPLAPPIEGAYQGIGVGHIAGGTQAYAGGTERIGGEPYGVVVPFDAEGHQLGQPWTGKDTPAGAFSGHLAEVAGELKPEGQIVDVAVDDNPTSFGGDWAAGDVFVATNSTYLGAFPAVNVVDILTPEASGGEKYVAQLTGTCEVVGSCPGKVIPFARPRNVAVDSQTGDVLVVDGEESVSEVIDIFRPGPGIDEYEFAGSVTGSPQGAFGHIRTIAVDGGNGIFAEGEIYVLEAGVVYQFDSAGQYVGRFSVPTSTDSIAVDPATHDVYLGVPEAEEGQVEVFGPSLLLPDVTTQPVSSLGPESATLNGTVNPLKAEAGETTCQFVWGTSESFGHVKPCPEPVAEGETSVPVSAHLEGLEPGTTYYYRLQASNTNGTNEGEASQTEQLTTPGPRLAEESVSGMSSTSVTLAALIDPNGGRSTYYFQYGTTATYGSDAPAAPGDLVAAGEASDEVTQHLQGLAPNTTYHYRVVVVSEMEAEPGVISKATFYGHDQTFATQGPGGSLALPDGRAWEMVSPVNKHGANILPIRPQGGILIQSSESGDSVAYVAFQPTEATAPGSDGGVQVLSERGSDGWSSQDLALSHPSDTGPGLSLGDFRFFSADLSLGLAMPPIGAEFSSLAPEVSPPDTEPTPYIRHNDTCSTQPGTCYLPLVTGAPGYADVPPGTAFGYKEEEGGFYVNVRPVGGTTDLSHVVLQSTVALTGDPVEQVGLYEWSAGKPPSEELQFVSGQGPSRYYKSAFPANGRDALSADGSRVIFETSVLGEQFGHLYQRDMTRGQTVQLDEVQPGASGAGSPSAVFQAASSDGSVVYFTDWQRLTQNSGASGARREADLYECKMSSAAGKETCALSDLTPEVDGQRANLKPTILGASKDGAYVYFVAAGVLSGQPGSNGEHAVPGSPNLYEIHNGTTQFIAVLSNDDESDWADESQLPFQLALPRHTARVSPNGQYLAFMSDRSLTGYDNVDVSSGKADQEVFLFDSASGRLICASCNASGARPQGVESKGVAEAANIPGWTGYQEALALYQSRYLDNSGRLFFNSSDALVPQDINKQEDVYEYEPVGLGGCRSSLPTYEAATGGCVSLITSGTSKAGSTFMDASENGDDVFFLTDEKLVGGDVDSAADVYDAHVCSVAAPCPSAASSSPPCATADACRTAPSRQPGIFGAPASSTFSGPGNATAAPVAVAKPRPLTRAQELARAVKACRRKGRRKRAACIRRARKRYGAKPSHRSHVTKGGRR